MVAKPFRASGSRKNLFRAMASVRLVIEKDSLRWKMSRVANRVDLHGIYQETILDRFESVASIVADFRQIDRDIRGSVISIFKITHLGPRSRRETRCGSKFVIKNEYTPKRRSSKGVNGDDRIENTRDMDTRSSRTVAETGLEHPVSISVVSRKTTSEVGTSFKPL